MLPSCEEPPLTIDESNPFTPPASFGPFRVLHQIGIGVLGPVFRAYQPELDRLAAVKLFRLDMTPEQASAVARELEAVIATHVADPGMVRPLAAGVEGSLPYLAEEYVAAESLDVALRHYAPAPFDQALPFVRQLAGAIDAAAEAGIVHGTMHPRDIFVTPDQARATGFGVANALERIGLRAPVRRPYSAPERMAGEPLSLAADIFAVAAIAYELLSARRVAGTGEQIASLLADLGREVDGERLKRVFAKGLAEDPARRYATASGFASALEVALERRSGDAVEDTDAAGSMRRKRSRRAKEEKPLLAETRDAVASTASADVPADAPPVRIAEAAPADAVPPSHTGVPAWDDKELELGARSGEGEPAGSAALPASASFPPSGPAPHAAESLSSEDISPPLAATERRPFAPIDFETTRGRSRPRRTALVTPGLDEIDDVLMAEPIVEPGGMDWRLSLVAFVLTLGAGFLIGLLYGYQLGSRRAAEAQLASSEGRQTFSEGTVGRSPSDGRADALPGPPPVPRTRGRMLIRSTPAGAQVVINGKPSGETPLDLRDMPFGNYDIRMSRDGFVDVRRRIVISTEHPIDSETVTLEAAARPPPALPPATEKTASTSVPEPVDIPPAPPLPPASRRAEAAPVLAETADQAEPPGAAAGAVYFDSRPSGARVLVDGRPIGTTPLRVSDLGPGSHRVRFERDGYHPWATSFTVELGRESRVSGSLEPR